MANYNSEFTGAEIDARLGSVGAEFDASTAYPIGSVCVKDGVLYRKKMGVETESWKASHWTEMTLTDAISAMTEYTAVPLSDWWSHNDGTSSDVTYTYDSSTDTFTVVGTTSDSLSFINQYNNTSALPLGFTAGEDVYLDIESTDEGIRMQCYWYDSNSSSLGSYNIFRSSAIPVPSDAVGAIIRIYVPASTSVNGTFRYRFYSAPPAYESAPKDSTRVVRYETPNALGYTDINDIKENSVFFTSSTEIPDNFPIDGAGWLETTTVPHSNACLQVVYPYSITKGVWFRTYSLVYNAWLEWTRIDNGVTYNITQTINRDEINNTYNITSSPTITTDSHGWLMASGDTTDRTADILTMLTDTGYCHLGEGTFYVSGIDMPNYSTLEGCGNSTILHLTESVTSGYVVQPTTGCTISNIQFVGGSSAPSDVSTESPASLGSRHGVYCVGNYDESTSHSTVTGYYNKLTNCTFFYFDGAGIYMANTGMNVRGYLIASDVFVNSCMVGIWIDWYSEYNKFTNFSIRGCNHACINNAGNNVFTSCTFHGVVGFLMDNSGSDKPNNSHGTCSACSINHINSNNGYGVVIKNNANGFIFDGCQLWYSKIKVEQSRGMSFSDCLIGGGTPTIEVSGSYPAFFHDCTFHASPSITGNAIMTNCYLDSDGSAVTA